MARFDVFCNSSAHAVGTPYLLDVQSDLLNGLDTRIVFRYAAVTTFPPARCRNA
jgi:toxin CcdB